MDYGWNWITERLALGGSFASPADADALKAAGITHVINCTELCDPEYVESAFSMCWPNPRQPDDGAPRTARYFREGAQFWRSNQARKIYVHCHAGMNRSASMIYLFLRLMGLKPADARHLIATNRSLDLAGDLGSSILAIRYGDEADSVIACL